MLLLIQYAVAEDNNLTLRVLFDDPRTADMGELLIGLLNSDDILGDVAQTILRSKQLQLDEVSPILLEERLSRILLLSSREEIGSVCGNYSDCHYDMLLREIIVKERDYVYYLDWLIDRMNRSTISPEVRQLISSAAASVLSLEPVAHTSSEFTAYYGFFLFGNTRSATGGSELAYGQDIEAVINTMEYEDASQEGIDRVRRLLVGLRHRGELEHQR